MITSLRSMRSSPPSRDPLFTLPERLLLTSIDDRGRPRDPNSSLGHALAGAALTELLLGGRLRLEDGRVVAATGSPTGDTLLDEVAAEVRAEERPRLLMWWVNRLASRHRGRRPFRDRLIDQLTDQGVLARGERRVLGLVPVATHRVTNPATAELIRAAIGQVLLNRQAPDASAAALITLVRVSGLVDACVHDVDRRRARCRAKQIAAGNQVGHAVNCIEGEVTAAIMAAVAASSASLPTQGTPKGDMPAVTPLR